MPGKVLGGRYEVQDRIGTGGMATKIAAAKICFNAGCTMAIINSNRLEGIYDLLEGRQVGTIFRKED